MHEATRLGRFLRLALPAALLGAPAAAAGAQLPDATRVPTAAPDSAAAPLGTSAIDGIVADPAGRVLAAAVVTAQGLPVSDVTTGRGFFHVRGLPAGPRRFTIRRVGFQPVTFDLDLPDGATVHLQVTLRPSVVMLSTIVVDGEMRSLGLVRSGFYDRVVRQSQGYFYPPEEMERRKLTTLASLLTEIPGLHIERRNNEAVALGRSVGTGRCELNLWVDGTPARAAAAPLDHLAPAHLVRAVEVYPSASVVPTEYVLQNNLCGAVVVWTRGVVR
jgi:hypothetical protein